MTFANFITIQYALLVDRIPTLNVVFPNPWIFAVIFLAAYVPIALVVGYWHRKTQWRTETQALFNENPALARMWLFMLELIEGKLSEEEKNEMRNMLRRIIKKQPDQPLGLQKETKRILDED